MRSHGESGVKRLWTNSRTQKRIEIGGERVYEEVLCEER